VDKRVGAEMSVASQFQPLQLCRPQMSWPTSRCLWPRQPHRQHEEPLQQATLPPFLSTADDRLRLSQSLPWDARAIRWIDSWPFEKSSIEVGRERGPGMSGDPGSKGEIRCRLAGELTSLWRSRCPFSAVSLRRPSDDQRTSVSDLCGHGKAFDGEMNAPQGRPR
jgi:hypothetical protein